MVATRKRKLATMSGSGAPESTEEDVKSQRVPASGRKSSKRVEPEHPAAAYKTPSNPQATFTGLPAELRLAIYDHVCGHSIIHVHHHNDKFTWTPCRGPNPKSPLFCRHPKWSGLCVEEERCTYKVDAPPEPRGFWALAASSKAIRREAQDFFMRSTVISIDPGHIHAWLDHLAAHSPRQLEHLHRITLAGAYDWRSCRPEALEAFRKRVPNLEELGFQMYDSFAEWARESPNNRDIIQVDLDKWKHWEPIAWASRLDRSMTIALELMIWRRPRAEVAERQAKIRIVRKGDTKGMGPPPNECRCLKHGRYGWKEDDMTMKIVRPKELAASQKNAGWRQWWSKHDYCD